MQFFQPESNAQELMDVYVYGTENSGCDYLAHFDKLKNYSKYNINIFEWYLGENELKEGNEWQVLRKMELKRP